MTRAGRALAALAALAAGCADGRGDSCADSLAGVWRAEGESEGGEPLLFHVVDTGARVEVFPMFDATVPPGGDKLSSEVVLAPPVFQIDRMGRLGRGRALIGTRLQRMTRGGQACVFRRQAAIRECGGDAFTLAWVPVEGVVDWGACRARSGASFTRLRLRRASR